MMPPIILTLLQGLLLLLLYLFVARAVRAILRDVSATPRPAGGAAPAAARPSRPSSSGRGATPRGEDRPRRIAPSEIVVHNPDGKPSVLPLDDREIVFGRASDATVPIDDPYTSDHHARIYHDGTRWLIADLGSTNGTFLNQVKVTDPTPIAAGDQLGIGRTVVEVRK